MSYFENFLKANQAYVELHGDLHLPIKPKTQVAIVTCMDSRLHVAPALGLALGGCPYFAECRRARDRGHDSFLGHLTATDGDTRNRRLAPHRLWSANL